MTDVLSAVEDFIAGYVIVGVPERVALTLWAAHTHAIDAAESTPYIAITSPEKGSGKTRCQEVLEQLVARPWMTGRVTPAVLVRKVHAEKPTLLLDESDAAFNGNSEYAEALRGILNTGYRQTGRASLCIARGNSFEFADYSTFCPKCIAGLGKLPDTIESRSVVIQLKRRAKNEHVRRFRLRDVPRESAPIREELAAWRNSTSTRSPRSSR
jgi:hypothetical protein